MEFAMDSHKFVYMKVSFVAGRYRIYGVIDRMNIVEIGGGGYRSLGSALLDAHLYLRPVVTDHTSFLFNDGLLSENEHLHLLQRELKAMYFQAATTQTCGCMPMGAGLVYRCHTCAYAGKRECASRSDYQQYLLYLELSGMSGFELSEKLEEVANVFKQPPEKVNA